ncbi:MAG: muconolactone Delta-isomerase family protein [Myxococcota bacterium]
MKYLVRMRVTPPREPHPEFERRKQEEKAMALRLQREGTWVHLWRVVGAYENYSVFEVADHDALHELLMGLPLAPWLDHQVVPLAVHPSSLEANP